MTWDARLMLAWTASFDCAQIGWPQMGIQPQWLSARQPAPPTAYRP